METNKNKCLINCDQYRKCGHKWGPIDSQIRKHLHTYMRAHINKMNNTVKFKMWNRQKLVYIKTDFIFWWVILIYKVSLNCFPPLCFSTLTPAHWSFLCISAEISTSISLAYVVSFKWPVIRPCRSFAFHTHIHVFRSDRTRIISPALSQFGLPSLPTCVCMYAHRLCDACIAWPTQNKNNHINPNISIIARLGFWTATRCRFYDVAPLLSKVICRALLLILAVHRARVFSSGQWRLAVICCLPVK